MAIPRELETLLRRDAEEPKPKTRAPRPGWIYLIANDSMPGLVKIGLTTRSVEERLAELDTTGVATPFRVVEQWLTPDVRGDEATAHRHLSRHRVREGREFFALPAEEARTRLAELFADNPRLRPHRGLKVTFWGGFWIAIAVLVLVEALIGTF